MIFYTILIHLLVISDSNIFKNILNSKKKGKLHKVEDLKFSPISTLGKINEKSDETLNPIVEVVQLLSPIISTVVWFYASKSLSSHLMNLIQKSIDIDTPSQNLPKNLIQFVKVNSTLSSYECDVLSSVITPDSGKVCLDMIGGIEDVKLGLWECIMSLKNVPSVHSNMIDSSISNIFSPVKGALLFGPPGCGKTMLVVLNYFENNSFILIRFSSYKNVYFLFSIYA
jgi:ATP-dependent 26S proteasome regulatory subunit